MLVALTVFDRTVVQAEKPGLFQVVSCPERMLMTDGGYTSLHGLRQVVPGKR